MIDIEVSIHECPHCDGLCARDHDPKHQCVECGKVHVFEVEPLLEVGSADGHAQVERLTAELADRDRRIEAALTLLQLGRCADRNCTTTSCVNAWAATDALRGESDE